MLFSELYSAYYHTVAGILRQAIDHPLKEKELRDIISQNAFGESALTILPALKEERWQLLRPDGTTILEHAPSWPLTMLQKRWLKSITLDPRMKLFGDILPDLADVEPLFLPADVLVFDKYADGDDYEDETYIANFRLILDAIRKRCPLCVEVDNRRGKPTRQILLPEYLEYSEKDDKFRLIGAGKTLGSTINLGRIRSCIPYEGAFQLHDGKRNPARPRSVVFELNDQRKALERVLLHFAHFRKMAEKTGEDTYRVTVYYDKDDETEMVIRILSFGPLIRVTAPVHFVNLITERLWNQKNCGH